MNTLQEILCSKEFWAAALQALAGLLQGLATVAAVWLAYHFGLRQLRQNTQIQVQQDLRQRQADALKAAWALLAYLSEKDNQHNLLRTVQAKGSKEKNYFMHLHNAQTFVFAALPQAFYAQGAGLLWPSALKDKFFEARGIVYGLLLAEKQAHAPLPDNAPPPCLVHNPQAAQRLLALYAEINELLRKEVNTVYGIF